MEAAKTPGVGVLIDTDRLKTNEDPYFIEMPNGKRYYGMSPEHVITVAKRGEQSKDVVNSKKAATTGLTSYQNISKLKGMALTLKNGSWVPAKTTTTPAKTPKAAKTPKTPKTPRAPPSAEQIAQAKLTASAARAKAATALPQTGFTSLFQGGGVPRKKKRSTTRKKFKRH